MNPISVAATNDFFINQDQLLNLAILGNMKQFLRGPDADGEETCDVENQKFWISVMWKIRNFESEILNPLDLNFYKTFRMQEILRLNWISNKF